MKKVISISQTNFNIDEIKNLIPSHYLIVFFAPPETINTVCEEIAKHYTNSIGCSSHKNISKDICSTELISILGIEITDAKLCLLPNISKKYITYYSEISDLKTIYKKNHSLLLEFTDGLASAEESILSVIANELPMVPLIGSSAADNFQFKETKVCVNGKTMSNATALCMFTTDLIIENYFENIYEPATEKAIITDCDYFNKTIYKINNKPAIDYYCNCLNISKDKIEKEFVSHPIARLVGKHYFISTVTKYVDNNLFTCTRNFKHSYISICNSIDYLSYWNSKIKNDEINNIKYCGGIFVNCAFRTMQFENQKTMTQFQHFLEHYGDFICTSSYGEHFNQMFVSQTMAYCLFREN